MSNALAIAGVTAVLKDLLDSGLIENRATDAVDAAVLVSSLAPDVIPLAGDDALPRLNLFLHQVTPNAAWRNVDLPSRSVDGRRIATPPLALDLHYLLTAYGYAELQAEVLLGYAMQLFHEHPIISRAEVRNALTPAPVDGAILPSIYRALRSADLAEQVELLKIVPTAMNAEEMSRLWSALTAHYRPSAAFQVSVVLIEARARAVSPLPVLTRGRFDPVLGRDEGVRIVPGLQPPYPTLTSVVAAHQTPSTLQIGDLVTVSGHHLGGSSRAIVLRNDVFDEHHEIAVPDGTDDASVDFTASVPDAMPAGLYRLELRVVRPGELATRTSNAMPVALAPSLILSSVSMTRGPMGPHADVLILRIACRPAVRAGQSVALMLDTRRVQAQPLATASATLLEFHVVDGPPAGATPLLRLTVGGIDSVVLDRGARPPAFFDHRLTLTV